MGKWKKLKKGRKLPHGTYKATIKRLDVDPVTGAMSMKLHYVKKIKK